uniref:Selenoprotein H n=1 Tax=Nothobranchius furzeri TaxID=105023 RepID=A0A8C6KNP4_NOTFU
MEELNAAPELRLMVDLIFVFGSKTLLAIRPGLSVVINPDKPRRNSFEISLLDGDKETSLWSGIKKGPPRKMKFPQPEAVAAALQEALKSE